MILLKQQRIQLIFHFLGYFKSRELFLIFFNSKKLNKLFYHITHNKFGVQSKLERLNSRG